METDQSDSTFEEVFLSLPKNHELSKTSTRFNSGSNCFQYQHTNFRSRAAAILNNFCWPLKESSSSDKLTFKVLVKKEKLLQFRQEIARLGFTEYKANGSNDLDKEMERDD